MNKKELTDAVALAAECSKAHAESVVNTILTTITETLKAGDKVSLIGFGTFSTSKRVARKGRNPQTGIEIDIPEKTVVKFKAGKALNESVNN